MASAGDILGKHLTLPSLRGLWTFGSVDEDGRVYDYSEQGRQLTDNATVTYGYEDAIPYAEFNGTTQYLLNNLTPTSGWSMFVHYQDLTSTGAAIIVGSQNTTGDRRFYLGRAAGGAEIYGNGGIAVNGAIAGVGTIGFAGEKCYFNGVDEGLTISSWSDPISAQPIFAGALNANGTATTFCAVKIHALAIYNTVLQPRQISLLSRAMAEV